MKLWKQIIPTLYRYQFSTRSHTEPPYMELQRDFIDPKDFYNLLKINKIDFYTGVPDSLLKDFCGYVTDHTPEQNHIIASNEGLAVSLAAGYYLASKRIPCVYLQNSGLGNIINPLMSLAHQKVYGIPMLLLIGWRGEPGKKDEPQHIVQGKKMAGMLTELGLPFEVLPDYIEGATQVIEQAVHTMKNRQTPYALLVRRQCFTQYKLKNEATNPYQMTREDALKSILPLIGEHDVIIGTTGFLSRELYEYRIANNQSTQSDFYCVGSMGHASSIALGIAMIKKSRQVYCFDGDGAALMHLGALPTIGQSGASNLKHIVFNNGSHDSVGAQPSVGLSIDFGKIALASGYRNATSVSDKSDIFDAINQLRDSKGPSFMEIKIKSGARKDLGRPKSTTEENKRSFMEFLKQ